ncbi:glutamate ligase domain-containing protein [Streptacidiphilus melanogenes]|uniref:glutamate ligase domain-containing protein n=1 Tax=Streptacidiphilus melanogenes TaxID=411235 RepID=UPI000694D6F8|nr:cyanophycin synthetase [Streptacidiphilus melanogenes]
MVGDPEVAAAPTVAMASRTRARVVLVGRTRDAHLRAEDVQVDDLGRARFHLVTPDEGRAEVALRLAGEHHVANALTAAAVGREAGLSIDRIAAQLSTAKPASRWRMEVTERPDGVTVINDAYNANPDSMRAGLEALKAMARGRRAVAVLGEMRELGAESNREHTRLGELVAQLGIAHLIAVGGAEAQLIEQAARRGNVDTVTCADPQAASTALQQLVLAGDVVLVKASRAAGLQTLAEHLAQPDDAAADRDGHPARPQRPPRGEGEQRCRAG